MTRWLLDLLNRHWHRKQEQPADIIGDAPRLYWDDEDWPTVREDAR